MAAVCRDRAAELAALPVFQATALVINAVVAVTRALATRDLSASEDALGVLRGLLELSSLREVAIKASRLKSLANLSIQSSAMSRR
jgi:hypothetical protein